MLRKIILGSKEYKYIEEQLSAGGILAHNLQKLDLRVGIPMVYLPTDVDIEKEIVDLSESLEWLFGKDATALNRAHANGVINKYLGRSENNCFLFETDWYVTDPIVNKSRFQYVSYNGEVIGFLANSSSTQLIQESLSFARGYPFIGVLTTITNLATQISLSQEVEIHDLLEFVAGTKYIIVGAFDDEGYIIWEKEGENDSILDHGFC